MPLRSEMNYGNFLTPYDAKINVGCLPLRSEKIYGNIRLRMTLKQMSGGLPLRSEMNYGNIRLRMTLKQMSGVCLYVRKWITVIFDSRLDAKINVGVFAFTFGNELR